MPDVPPLTVDPSEIRRALRVLFRQGDTVELRAPKAGRDGTISGYFDNAEELVKSAIELDRRVVGGQYITLNTVDRALLARSANRLKFRAELTTSDINILRRRFLLVDADPIRPAGVSSTDEEHRAALECVGAVRDGLASEGWSTPILADSGNGGHLLYPIDLPNDQATTDLIKKCLQALNQRYGDARVSIDIAVYNAARISKLYGTIARKGDHTPERPHRPSRILEAPEHMIIMRDGPLTRFAARVTELPSVAMSSGVNPGGFNLEAWMDRHNLMVRRGPLTWEGRGEKWELVACPFNLDHTGGCAVVTRAHGGALGFKCQHNSCDGRGWRELRELVEGPRQERAGIAHELVVVNAPAEPAGETVSETPPEVIPTFPEIAWRGIFAQYRDATDGTTEASDVAHFTTLLAAAAVNLGRRVSMFAGDEIFANMYLLFFGPTGDKKTTAERRLFHHGLVAPEIPVLRGVGSPEGLGDLLQKDGAVDTVYLFFWEEISALLARGRWSGASILEFLTETYDCPPEYRLAYRKQPLHLIGPAPTVLAGTTADWFWKNARPEDFYGGFGNRITFFTGVKKPPLPSPREPDAAMIKSVREKLVSLASLPPTRAVFSRQAQRVFDLFYIEWEGKARDGLHGAAVKRIHVHARKIAMVYAACEGTLPEITLDQAKAAIAVALYTAECTRLLIETRESQARPEGDLERRFLDWVKKHEGALKRHMQQTLSKYAGSCKMFNETLLSLTRADHVEVRDGRVYLKR